MLIHRLWNNVYHRWITNNFPCKWHRTASTASGCKSSPRKIFHWNSSGDNREGKKTSLSTAKATSSTKRPQTCTEPATKYYNYTVNETDEEREHRLPTLPKATRLDQATLKVYCQNYLLRCSDRQPPRGGGNSSYERGGDARGKFWIQPLKETDLGVAQAFLTLKETMLKHRQYTNFYIFSRATLNETFTAKYGGFLPRTP